MIGADLPAIENSSAWQPVYVALSMSNKPIFIYLDNKASDSKGCIILKHNTRVINKRPVLLRQRLIQNLMNAEAFGYGMRFVT